MAWSTVEAPIAAPVPATGCSDNLITPGVNTINMRCSISRYLQAGSSLRWYFLSLLVMTSGMLLAVRHFPGGFDWPYTVVSALMSQKHNPDGSGWFAISFSLSMLLLWPYVSYLKTSLPLPHARVKQTAIVVLRIGLICGTLLGLERLLVYDLSHWLYKAHEAIALLTFLAYYVGIVMLWLLAMLWRRQYVWPVILGLSPLLAIGLSQLWLYLEQRDLGWVDSSWRAQGIPIWLSFAFWQWLAIGFLWLGLGLLNGLRQKGGETRQ